MMTLKIKEKEMERKEMDIRKSLSSFMKFLKNGGFMVFVVVALLIVAFIKQCTI
jgi:hypothetical protein